MTPTLFVPSNKFLRISTVFCITIHPNSTHYQLLKSFAFLSLPIRGNPGHKNLYHASRFLPTGINNFQVHDSVEQFYKVPTPKLAHWTSRQRKETNLASALPFLFPVFCMRASFILLSCTSSLRGKPGVISTFPLDFIPNIRLCIENVVQRLTLSLPCGIE